MSYPSYPNSFVCLMHPKHCCTQGMATTRTLSRITSDGIPNRDHWRQKKTKLAQQQTTTWRRSGIRYRTSGQTRWAKDAFWRSMAAESQQFSSSQFYRALHSILDFFKSGSHRLCGILPFSKTVFSRPPDNINRVWVTSNDTSNDFACVLFACQGGLHELRLPWKCATVVFEMPKNVH